MKRDPRTVTKLVPVPSTNIIPERDVDKSPILECRHLGIDFGGLTAVDDFNMAIGRTEIAGLIGPNGAGKTTVFNLLTRVYQPTRGTVLVDGHDTAGKTTTQISHMGIARTFQNIRLFKELTVMDNVLIGLHHEMDYRLPGAIFRLPGYWAGERIAVSGPVSCWAFLICRIWWTIKPALCLTAPSAAWRLSGLWPQVPAFCCWMSRRRA